MKTGQTSGAEEETEDRVRPSTAAAPAVADGFDAVTHDELPVEMEADFAPLPEAGAAPGDPERAVDPFQYDSLQAQAAFDAAVAIADEKEAVQEYIRAAKIAETAHEWHLVAVACQRVGDFLLTPQPPCDVERAFRMYRRAVAAYEQCGLFAEARRLAYRQMCLKMQRARELNVPLLHRIELVVYWAIAGFGYRPLRVIGTALITIVCYGFIYWAVGGVQRVGYEGPISLLKAIYFSGITFATVGYGDFIPAEHTRFLALTEGVLGIFTTGLFVAVLANRLNRS